MWIRASGTDALRFLNGMWTSHLTRANEESAHGPVAGLTYLLDLKARPVSYAIFLAPRPNEFVFSLPAPRKDATLEALERLIIADDVTLTTESTWSAAYDRPEGAEIAVPLPPFVPEAHDRLFRAVEEPWGYRIPRGVLGEKHDELWVKAGAELPFASTSLTAEQVRKLRIDAGAPEWGVDYDETSFLLEFPHAEGISFHKGCYVGQEVVARATHRGHLTRGFARMKAEQALETGPIYSETDPTKVVGKLTTVEANRGLGLVRFAALAEGLVAPHVEGARLFQPRGETRNFLTSVECLAS